VILLDLLAGVNQVAPEFQRDMPWFVPGTCLTTQNSGRIGHEFIPGACLTIQNNEIVQEEKEGTNKY